MEIQLQQAETGPNSLGDSNDCVKQKTNLSASISSFQPINHSDYEEFDPQDKRAESDTAEIINTFPNPESLEETK